MAAYTFADGGGLTASWPSSMLMWTKRPEHLECACMRPAELVTAGASLYLRRQIGVAVPSGVMHAVFRLFGACSAADRATLIWQMAGSPSPAMRRLRSRAVRAVRDYQSLLVASPALRPVLRLDFCFLLGLYADVTGIDLSEALEAGLVHSYCHLAALMDAYDDVLDRPDARAQSFTEDDFKRRDLVAIRDRLACVFRQHAQRSPAAHSLMDELRSFELSALRDHQRLDQGTGLDAPLDAVLRAREATSGRLLRFAARMWNSLLALPNDVALQVEKAAAVFGVVAQFADDMIDWTTDLDTAQNLLDAALRQHPAERAAAIRAIDGRSGWSLPITRLRRLAPRSLESLDRARVAYSARYPTDRRFLPLITFGDDVYSAFLPALPAIDFNAFDDIRDQVQCALSTLGT